MPNYSTGKLEACPTLHGGLRCGAMKELGRDLRHSFFAGLLVVAPIAVSLSILWWLFTKLTDWLLPVWVRAHLSRLPYPEVLFRVLALLLVVALVTLVGWVTRLVVGRQLLEIAERIIRKVPLLNRVYGFMKEVSNTLLGAQRTVFQKVVLVEYPRAGVYTIGFVTGQTAGDAQAKTQQTVMNVFFPTTPNPTSGWLALVPREQIIELDMSVGEGMKMIVSGGVVVPPTPPRTRAPSKEGR